MKKTTKALLSATLLFGLIPLASCGKKHETHETKTQNLQFDPNSQLKIALNNISDLKPIAGIYTSEDEANARARIGGTLVSLLVDEGTNVTQGQLIGVIDEARFGAEVQAGQANALAAQAQAKAAISSAGQAPANLDAARAMAAKAQADYNRTKQLYDQGVYAKAKLDQMEAQILSANANVKAAMAGVAAANSSAQAAQSQAQSANAQAKIAQAIRAQGKIYAPRTGKITLAPIPKGSVVMPGEIIAFIASGAPILRIRAPESDAKYLKLGQIVQLIDDNGIVKGQSKITKIYPMVENGQVKADLASDGFEHLVGERVNILLPTGNRNAIIIPKSYLITRQGVDFVMLLRGKEALEIPVQRGINAQYGDIKDGVEIISGLEINDIIVARNGK